MGKPSAPAAPDYTPIAQADATIAQQQFDLGQQQLWWGQQQFYKIWPYAKQYLTQQMANSQALLPQAKQYLDTQLSAASAAQATAQNQQQFYDTTYRPVENSFAAFAGGYNSPVRANENAGSAMADVASSFDQSRSAALSQLESYGIDPSQTRFSALDLGTRISQAAATAAAGTQSRLNTQGTGLALQGEAINVGRGYPSAIANSYATATSAGSGGFGAGNQTIGTGTAAGASGLSLANSTAMTGANLADSARGFTNTGLAANAGAVGALNTGFNNQLAGAEFNAQQSNAFSQGIGSLLGGGLGFASMAGFGGVGPLSFLAGKGWGD